MGDTLPPKLGELFGSFDGVIDSIVPVGILLAVVMIILSGYKWMTSAGNPEKIQQAQATLTWAIIGLVVLLLIGMLIRGLVDYIVGM
ncbi:pilin [bacterium]|nr:pilin [bacterium]